MKTVKKTFSKLTRVEKRLAIVNDVLVTLRKRKSYRVTNGFYCELPEEFQTSSADLQEILPVVEPFCQVCALGSLLVSKARLFDAVGVSELGYSAPEQRAFISSNLGKYFSQHQLDDIELAFEGKHYSLRIDRTYDATWLGAYPDATKRLRAICQNIIRNNGTFKIKELTAPRGAK